IGDHPATEKSRIVAETVAGGQKPRRRTRPRLFHAITACFQAGGDCAPVLFAALAVLRGTYRPVGLRRIVAGLVLRPGMALVAIRRLLGLILAVPRVDIEVVGRGGRPGGRGGFGVVGTRRRIHDRIAVQVGTPAVIDVVRVVKRHATEPQRRVERRQYRDGQAYRRARNHEAQWARRVPGAAAEVEAPAVMPGEGAITFRQRAHDGARSRVVVAMVVAVVQHEAASVALEGLVPAVPVLAMLLVPLTVLRVDDAGKPCRCAQDRHGGPQNCTSTEEVHGSRSLGIAARTGSPGPVAA